MALTVQYTAHSDLPLPAYTKSIKLLDQDKLLAFLNSYGESASKFTIDGGNVGKPIVCAFLPGSTTKAIMLNLNKQGVSSIMYEQGYICSAVRDSRVINCVKKKNLSKL